MAQLQLTDVTKLFGKTRVIEGLHLTVKSGEFVVLVGPSGCGKSTILRMIAGLEDLSSGSIKMDGNIINNLSPKERGVAMVFQNYALYPHMTVRDNISFGLKLASMPKDEIKERVFDAAKTLNLTDYLDKKPGQLSGGQKQRVAMGRAMVRRPKLFLFDEPLSNLDAALRVRMRAEIAQLHKGLDCTTIYVTHDQVEAMTLADRIAVVNGGKIEQFGTPMELYNAPQTKFVASFLGMPPMNFLPVKMIQSQLVPSAAVTVGFRAEDTQVVNSRSSSVEVPSNEIRTKVRDVPLPPGSVKMVELLGGLSHIHVRLSDDQDVVVETRSALTPELIPRIGDVIELTADASRLFFFDADGRTIFKT